MRVLAIDTALGQCAACVLDTEAGLLAEESIALERGHAEVLMPLLERVMSQVEGGFSALDRVAVTVGPGSFTGLRVGIAAARAIALAAGVPAVGVTTLSALIAPFMAEARSRLVAAAIDARNGRVYAQALAPSGRLVVQASVMTVRELVRALGSTAVTLVGSGASTVAVDAWSVGLEALVHPGPTYPEIAWVARLGAAARPGEALPKPLYLSPPDARPQAPALPRL
ncbi:MAG: tRNA (adenosine(37)-N6)-threonylcarbamoyltransferase complex dimerization subunit type 1 TsaB [Methylobacteriaceae bacterium]|nr:tRNA (adenosine(37)-N6)-threonylcarbamoyltransferase complex dimerization subunit type 1 TsaB [Methylobacteriaceae bacterium]